MSLLELHDQLLRKKIREMPIGQNMGLVKIFGDDWDQIGSPGQKKEFGRLFKAAVSNETYPDIKWIAINNSGRYDLYCKHLTIRRVGANDNL